VTLLGLDTVSWERYEHAYGPADGVPDLLRALAANDDDWDDALGELCGAVFHQSTCYSATALVVPWLAQLAADRAVSAVRRLWLLAYLCDMAAAADASAVYLADRARRRTTRPRAGRSGTPAAPSRDRSHRCWRAGAMSPRPPGWCWRRCRPSSLLPAGASTR
jgi:hypothetical protein